MSGWFKPNVRSVLAEAAATISAQTLKPSAAQLDARRLSLRDFVKWSWPLLEPATPLVWNFHLDCIVDHVAALLAGTLGRQNLMILVPPGFAKSTLVSVAAPVWKWINSPSWRGLFASGNERVSTRDSTKRRLLIEHPAFAHAFGLSWTLAADANLKTRYENSARGFHQALSTGQRVTGDRADSLFIDDPQDAGTIHSAAERAAVERWYFEAFANRLADMQRGTRCLIMQRLHSLDLAGLVLEREPAAWEVLTIPMLWDEKRRFTSSLGWSDPRTEDGALAFPARFPQAVVDAERGRLGRSAFASQHQQEPFDADGEVFPTDKIQVWPQGSPLPVFRRRILSLDTAFSTKTTADYSVMLEVGEFDRGYFIISVLRARLEYPQLKAAVVQLAQTVGVCAVIIEDKASGQSLVQDLRQTTKLPVIPIKVDADKITRAHACVPTVESARIFVPRGAPWVSEFVTELTAFPKGMHDDQVDAFTQALAYFAKQSAGQGLIDFYTAQAELSIASVAVANHTNAWASCGGIAISSSAALKGLHTG